MAFGRARRRFLTRRGIVGRRRTVSRGARQPVAHAPMKGLGLIDHHPVTAAKPLRFAIRPRGQRFQPFRRMEHERLALAIAVQQRRQRLDRRRFPEAPLQPEPLHRIGVVHLAADQRRRGRAAHGLRHPARHAVGRPTAAPAAQLPGQRQPQLVAGDLQQRLDRERSLIRTRVVVADVHRHHAAHPLRMTRGKLIAEDAAPVVQQQRDRLVGADGLHDGIEQRVHLGH